MTDEAPDVMLNRFYREAVTNLYAPLWFAVNEMWPDLTDAQRDCLKPLMRDGAKRFPSDDEGSEMDGGH